MAENIQRITIDTGVKSYEVADLDGNVLGVIRFNPTNTDIVVRLNKLNDRLQSEDFEKEIAESEAVGALAKMNQRVRDALDEAIGSPVSDVFFSTTAPISRTKNGNRVQYTLRVLQTITDIIGVEMNEFGRAEIEQVESAAAKYEGR